MEIISDAEMAKLLALEYSQEQVSTFDENPIVLPARLQNLVDLNFVHNQMSAEPNDSILQEAIIAGRHVGYGRYI